MKRPGTIHVVIGKPWDTTEGADSLKMTENVKNWIESHQKTLETN